MGNEPKQNLSSFELPPRKFLGREKFVAAPTYESFVERFGNAFPTPQFLESDLGITALYDMPPLSGNTKRSVLIIHGLNTPAHGMWPLARELQALDPDAHIVLFDLWGHGFSSTPLVAHTPQIFHSQIQQVLGFMQWTKAHILGFSFGGATAVSFANYNSWAVESVGLLAPAGLLQFDNFDQRMQHLLENSEGDYEEATKCVLSFLEGGPLIVPDDWQKRVMSGKVVAEALRKWNLEEHQGYRHSVLSMFRDGGVHNAEEDFRKFAGLNCRKFAVLAALDDVCTKEQLTELGLSDIEIVPNANHSFVRIEEAEVARIVHRYWL